MCFHLSPWELFEYPCSTVWCKRWTALWAFILTLRPVDLCSSGNVFIRSWGKTLTRLLENGSEEGTRCRQNFPFFVSVLRKILGFLKLVDEKYGPFKKKHTKKYWLWEHLVIHILAIISYSQSTLHIYFTKILFAPKIQSYMPILFKFLYSSCPGTLHPHCS